MPSAETMVLAGLGAVFVLVLVLPFMSRAVEHNLELFLFIMGVGAAGLAGVLDLELAEKALVEPALISVAVLLSGLLFHVLRARLRPAVGRALEVVPPRVFMLLLVVVLGLASSVVTAIIAALILVEIVGALGLNRRDTVSLTVIACFAIGLGAALTPIGEPLATIAISKLNADFWYLARLLGLYIVPGVLALGLFAAVHVGRRAVEDQASGAAAGGRDDTPAAGGPAAETYAGVILRAARVYLFVMALVLLGEGFRPAIDRYVIGLSSRLLFWLNMVSAILDNATLTAAEISLKMSPLQVKSVLLGLLMSGGMLIPGNIPNIISAGKLRISSREWAALGVPLGLALMLIYFVVVFLLGAVDTLASQRSFPG